MRQTTPAAMKKVRQNVLTDDPAFVVLMTLVLPGLAQFLDARWRAAGAFGVASVTLVAIGAFVPEFRALAWGAAGLAAIWSAVDVVREHRAATRYAEG
jgi:hypothetical protein